MSDKNKNTRNEEDGKLQKFSLILAPKKHNNSEKGTYRCILIFNLNAFFPHRSLSFT